MKTLTTNLSVLALLATGALAQNPSYTYSYGDSHYGGSVAFAGHASFANAGKLGKSADLGGSMTARVRMAGVDREAVHLAGDVDASFAVSSFLPFTLSPSLATAVTVRIAGTTVFSRTRSDAQQIGGTLAPANVFGNGAVLDSVTVGPFTLTVKDQAQVSIDFSLHPSFSLAPLSVGLQLRGDAAVSGSATASASAFGVEVGVQADMQFSKPVVTLDVGTDFGSITGTLAWSVKKIHLLLEVFANTMLGNWSATVLDNDFNGTTGSMPIGS